MKNAINGDQNMSVREINNEIKREVYTLKKTLFGDETKIESIKMSRSIVPSYKTFKTYN